MHYEEVTDSLGRKGYKVFSEKLLRELEDDTDEKLLHDGYAVVTPMTYDMTDHGRLSRAKAKFERDY